MGLLIQQTKVIFCLIFLLITLCYGYYSSAQDNEEETYSISLTQTAEVDKEIHQVDNRKVLTESYTVQEGDRIWQIFRERGLLKNRNLMSLLDALKKLNKSLDNLDLIHPGDRIIIPLQISPIAGAPMPSRESPPIAISPEDLKDIDLQDYIIKPGDRVIKVLQGLNEGSDENLYYDYLDLLKKLNPSIDDFDTVYPGQSVRLPIFSPRVFRAPIEPPQPTLSSKEMLGEERRYLKQIGQDIGRIFLLLGEEWVDKGIHFIPLKSGGQINLKAESYPIINLENGDKIILDLYQELPDRMANLIRSSWESYQVVHLEANDDLRKALDRIISHCNYQEVKKTEEHLDLGNDMSLAFNADWIIKFSNSDVNKKEKIAVLTLCNNESRTSNSIRDFLGGLGLKLIEYPVLNKTLVEEEKKAEIITIEGDPFMLVDRLLTLAGQIFERDEKIPVYQSEGEDLNLIIEADFLMNIGGEDRIIDLSGIGNDIVNMLIEHRFQVLQIIDEKDSSILTKKILKFLDVPYSSGSQKFLISNQDYPKGISLGIPGIVFMDYEGKKVIATPLHLPKEIANFLAIKGYKILQLGF